MSPELYLAKYDPVNYHCVHFVFDVIKDVYGDDLAPMFAAALLPIGDPKMCTDRRNLILLPEPETYCLAFLQHKDDDKIHAGVFANGYITHLSTFGVKIEKPHMMAILYNITYYGVKK